MDSLEKKTLMWMELWLETYVLNRRENNIKIYINVNIRDLKFKSAFGTGGAFLCVIFANFGLLDESLVASAC